LEFNFVHLRIHIATSTAVRLVPFLYASGPAFSAAFRRSVCRTNRTECSSCPELSACPFPGLFGQLLASDPSALKRYQKPPLPFIFSFPSLADIRQQDGDIPCELVLVGHAIHHICDFMAALRTVLASPEGTAAYGAACVARVESLDYQRKTVVIAVDAGVPDISRVVTLDAAGVTEGCPRHGDTLGIRLLTPLKLVKDGQQVKAFDAGLFVRSLMRRVSSLAYYYCGLEMEADFRSCSEATERLELLEDRFCFGNCDRSMRLSGVMGEGCLSGDFRDLMTFLALGEYLHLGKGASFGMGAYQLF
jgi:hypothetical protein